MNRVNSLNDLPLPQPEVAYHRLLIDQPIRTTTSPAFPSPQTRFLASFSTTLRPSMLIASMAPDTHSSSHRSRVRVLAYRKGKNAKSHSHASIGTSGLSW